jgi:hypothetical protein
MTLPKVSQNILGHDTLFGAPLVLGQTMGNLGLTKLIIARTQRKPPPSPIYYSLRLFARPTSTRFFILGLLKGNPKTAKVWITATLRDYNFAFRPLIGMRFQAKL